MYAARNIGRQEVKSKKLADEKFSRLKCFFILKLYLVKTTSLSDNYHWYAGRGIEVSAGLKPSRDLYYTI